MSKIEFIEEGRLSRNEMGLCFGGGTRCIEVCTDGLKITYCLTELHQCGGQYSKCSSKDDLYYCSWSDAQKQVKIPVPDPPVTTSPVFRLA